MATKANRNPVVRDLRRMLDAHGLKGAVLVAITSDGRRMLASAGNTVARCDALGPVLELEVADWLAVEIDMALTDVEEWR